MKKIVKRKVTINGEVTVLYRTKRRDWTNDLEKAEEFSGHTAEALAVVIGRNLYHADCSALTKAEEREALVETA